MKRGFFPERPSTPKRLHTKAQGKRSATLGTAVTRVPTLKGLHTLLATALLTLPVLAFGDGLVDPRDMPGPLKEVGFDQHLGEKLPLDAVFADETGEAVTLGDYFTDRPVVLAFVYYDCPMLCPMVLNGIARTLGVLKLDAGEDFDVVAISIDPRETSYMAAGQKRATVKRYGREDTVAGWHFLTGDAESVRRVTEAAGFRYTYIEETKEFAHASGMIVATPDGILAQYLYGLDFSPKDARLALVEASAGQIGSVVDQILLYCFRYDPKLGKYTAVVTRILRLAGLVFLAVLGIFIWIMLRRDRLAARSTALGVASR